jgi:hypothetical protein
MTKGLKGYGKAGRPPGIPNLLRMEFSNSWVKSWENADLIFRWVAVGLPRQVVLNLIIELGLNPPGALLGDQLARLGQWASQHRTEIEAIREEFRQKHNVNAEKRREEYLTNLYTQRDYLFERQFIERDAQGRFYLPREFNENMKQIAKVEGFEEPSADKLKAQALGALVERMLNPPQEALVEAKVTILEVEKA